MSDRPESEVIAELAVGYVGPRPVGDGGLHAITVPEGATVRLIDPDEEQEARQPHPPRRKGTVTAYDADSFARLVNDLGPRDGHSRIYADPDDLRFVAVLNDHEGDGLRPGWGDHRVHLAIQRTPSWKAWRDHAGLGAQEEFAEHLEDHRADIADPPAADMLELAQTFQATIGAKFSGGARLHNGERHASYVEEVQGSAGRSGQVPIPETMTLRLVPFEGADPVEVEARIRFRIRDGRLAIGYVLHRADEIERAAFDQVRASIESNTEGVLAILGRPPVAG